MANEAPPEEAEEKKSGKLVPLLMWVVVALGSIGGGFATPYLVEKLDSGEEKESAEVEDPGLPAALIEFGEVTVNLNEARLNRYLRVNISLLIDKSATDELTLLLEENTVVLKSWLLSFLSEQGMADIRGATGQNRLRREILEHFNSVLFTNGPPRIRNVLFQEFNVQ